MSFFVVERSATDGALRVPVPQASATREAALEALSAAVAAGTATIDGEIFVVDLDAAVPVLLMPGAAAAPAPPIEEQAVYASWAEAVTDTEPSEGEALADALKRAASSLESEGIVAPESIESVARAQETTPWASGAPAVVAEPVSALEAVGSETPAGLPDDELATEAPVEPGLAELSAALDGLGGENLSSEAPEGESWPWANVAPVDEVAEGGESADEPEADEEQRDLIAETVASLQAETTEDVSLLTPVEDGADAFIPKPVILGDYDETETDEAVLEPEAPVPDEPDSPEEPIQEAAEDEGPDLAEPGGVPDAPDESLTPGYEAAGELDLAAYTCDDCIYANTCPKVGQSTPAECGSFQWKAE